MEIMNLSCEICDKIFNGPDPYQDHMHSQKHAKKVKQLSTDKNTPNDKIAKIFSDEFMIRHEAGFKCTLCNILVNSFKQGEGHIVGRKHQNALFAKNVVINGAKVISDNMVSSNILDNNETLSCKDISERVSCQNKIKNESELKQLSHFNFQGLKTNKDLTDSTSEKNVEEIRCNLCNLILNSCHQLQSHMEGRKHKNKLASKGLISSSEVSSTSDTLIKTSDTCTKLDNVHSKDVDNISNIKVISSDEQINF